MFRVTDIYLDPQLVKAWVDTRIREDKGACEFIVDCKEMLNVYIASDALMDVELVAKEKHRFELVLKMLCDMDFEEISSPSRKDTVNLGSKMREILRNNNAFCNSIEERWKIQTATIVKNRKLILISHSAYYKELLPLNEEIFTPKEFVHYLHKEGLLKDAEN